MSDLDRLITDEDTNEQYQLFVVENEASNAADGVEFFVPEEENQVPQPVPEMKRLQILAYSIGHFFNDLCSAMWFSFLLIYLEEGCQIRQGGAKKLAIFFK
ncbi:hypothetical protein M3Y97_00794700 [Aphelenchoides bicaudatus]|nr:hypothetical protein M3Y97_00794700 [Aphelenchoides bicaudatus]